MKEGLIYDIMVDVNKRPEGWNKELYDKLSYDFRIECAKNGEIRTLQSNFGQFFIPVDAGEVEFSYLFCR